jgi:very-short-patch-repair endonuclease
MDERTYNLNQSKVIRKHLKRTRSFEVLGITVLRFWNHEVDEHLEQVVLKIQNELV